MKSPVAEINAMIAPPPPTIPRLLLNTNTYFYYFSRNFFVPCRILCLLFLRVFRPLLKFFFSWGGGSSSILEVSTNLIQLLWVVAPKILASFTNKGGRQKTRLFRGHFPYALTPPPSALLGGKRLFL